LRGSHAYTTSGDQTSHTKTGQKLLKIFVCHGETSSIKEIRKKGEKKLSTEVYSENREFSFKIDA
jgi:hypothetical protein